MAGTLKVGALSDGTNSVSVEGVSRGSAKAWAHFNGTGSLAIDNSFNVTSITDQGTGVFSLNLAKPTQTTFLCVSGAGSWESDLYAACNVSQTLTQVCTKTTVPFVTANTTTGRGVDVARCYIVVHGD